ncbi:MAG: TonB-dependent receptor [Acidobacteriia bacterium]|nr:TonB-dependent receptor [Terriglobia bacterium]
MVLDPSGAAIPGATVSIQNPLTNYRQNVMSGANGEFRFTNVPLNNYHLTVTAQGFTSSEQDLRVQSTAPVTISVALKVAGGATTVEVEANGADLLENVPVQHNDVDQTLLATLPTTSPASGLSDAITLTAPGVVADSNGFFHPQGDHAQTSYYVDGQPINDQQSKGFSTQIPENAIQSMELITGMPSAQYGDKTSLVVDASTRSGLGNKPFGSFETYYGSFGTLGEDGSFGFGTAKFGEFIVLDSTRSGRFLDSPEFYPMHDIGNSEKIFDRLDFESGPHDALHLDLFAARNWFQIPTTYDQPGQDQRQRIQTFNVAPGYQHTFSSNALLTINPWVRRDYVDYYPSGDLFQDQPATLAQDRHLLNYGVRADLSTVVGKHTLKFGTEIKQTRLFEEFSLGITDPAFNPVCVDANGNPAGSSSITNPAGCASAGLTANSNFSPGLAAYDLTRGGSLLRFRNNGKVNQFAFYAQDSIAIGNWSFTPSIRIDQYNGLSEATGVEPRAGISYQVKKTGTVLRISYARTFETPYNENLLLSSAAGVGGLATNVFGAFSSSPLRPGTRNQYNTGVQQAFGRYLLIDLGYFWKFTRTAYDFDTLFNTPITFPISWRKSNLDGVSGRISTTNLKGFQAYLTLGHTRARFFGPETGGLIFNSPVDYSVFRIDHDQAYEQTVNLRYQRSKNAPWVDFTWRYDSGQVAGNVPDLTTALSLTAAQQAAIGFYCGSQMATITNAITTCNGSNYGAVRLVIPRAGTENPDTNPPRIASHHTFDLSAGTDNLFHTEPVHVTLKATVLNLSNEVSLYNFLSTFSGTHFITPRSYTVNLGVTF